MKIFLFEFASCGRRIVELSDGIIAEGLAMFFTFYSGFSRFAEVETFSGEYVEGKRIEGHLVKPDFFERRRIFNNLQEMKDAIAEEVEKSDCFLIIAPEDDFLLYELTRIAEERGENLGSSSKAIKVTSDKWELYKKLKGEVNVPKTSKEPIDGKFLAKPRISCGGEGIMPGSPLSRIPDGYIAQEYVEGLPLSVSFCVNDEIRVLSVNEQIINNFRYSGSVVPARLKEKMKEEVVEEARKAVECIDGLKGYVGVDVVYAEEPYIIEINARPTTSAVAFEFAYGTNVVEMLYASSKPKRSERFELRKGVAGLEGIELVRINDVKISLRKL